MNMNVIESALPPLLPIPFLKKLGMVYDADAGLVKWKKLGNRVSEVETFPSGHVAIDLLEFPSGGWICPHETPGKMVQNPDSATTRADFEVAQSFHNSSGFTPLQSPLNWGTSFRSKPLLVL